MKRRDVTPEERAQWRASNQFTQVKKEMEREAGPEHSSPLAGEVRSGVAKSPATGNARHLPASQLPPAREKGARQLSTREAARYRKTYPTIEATLDLHGLAKTEAYQALLRYLRLAQGRGARHLLVITGKGRGGEGVLRRELPQWLSENSAVLSFFQATPGQGGSGAMHVIIRKG